MMEEIKLICDAWYQKWEERGRPVMQSPIVTCEEVIAGDGTTTIKSVTIKFYNWPDAMAL